ncbi:MAG TPA: energy-coupling factor ABC transporter permease [Planctomycetota bacterium]|nr:energy-coupling factor ABC transporter permease [Planctomycetota bacterium]
MVLAMHMANELLSVPVAGVTLALGAALLVWVAWRARKTVDPEKLPLMGVMGAFVFAGQMINFTLPGMPGTSGHLGGGVLLAIVLGPSAGILVMAAILVVQCLLFQDGGLLALGCNIINMGVIPCLLGWGIYRLMLGPVEAAKPWRQYVAAWLACVVGVTGGAALVPVEAAVSGVLKISPVHFLGVMVGVHLVIGFVEGLITFAVVAYLRQVRPEALGLSVADPAGRRLSRPAVTATFLVTAALLAGVVSWFASSHPDGLEWSYMEHRYGDGANALSDPSETIVKVDALQAKWSLMPDYSRRSAALGDVPRDEEAVEEAGPVWPAVSGWGSLAGLVGTAVTLVVVYLIAAAVRRRQRLAA